MKTINALKLAAVASAVVFSVNVWPQSSDAAATAGASAPAASSKSATRKANRALSKQVLKELEKGGVSTRGMNVIAKNGAITLAGRVDDPSQIDKATSIAKGVSGVTSVKNSLTIQEGGQ
ncbi:transport-associated protein [Caballeronia calidae]|uniref:Transport-associated protein n=1 Tax=Caballeronia calidae TaxID=1777139 RepID=A0A158EFC2_9BURK|nr:BON domain-containing protein [Caballeronia calidae]SAL05514.1 transport-associated protein [Caballeronia calidae]